MWSPAVLISLEDSGWNVLGEAEKRCWIPCCLVVGALECELLV